MEKGLRESPFFVRVVSVNNKREDKSVPPFVVLRCDVPLLQRIDDGLYHLFDPWQEFEQERDVVFQPMVVVRFLTPLLCVAAFTAVVL